MQLSGGERLGWDQRGTSAAEIASLRFFLYVDGNRVDFPESSCGALMGDQAACLGRLPSLSLGEHTLEVTAVDQSGAESGRSAPLRVSVIRSTAVARPSAASGVGAGKGQALGPTADGLRLTLREIATGFTDPTDLALLPDGRVLVAERSGRVRIVESNTLLERPAVALDDVRADTEAAGLLSVVADPDFERTRFVYLVYTSDDGFRLSRFREAHNSLVERVVLLDGVPAAPAPVAALRFGPDGKLYLALDDGGEPSRAGDLGSYNGKVLRLNPDGTVPSDQAGLTPVFAANIGSARGFDWDLNTNTLWVAEGSAPKTGLLAAVVDEGARARRGRIVTRYSLPDRAVPSSVVIYRHQLMRGWRGDLLVGMRDDGVLLRLALDPNGSGRVVRTEEILDGAAGRVKALAVNRDGVLYLANESSLLTLSPTEG